MQLRFVLVEMVSKPTTCCDGEISGPNTLAPSYSVTEDVHVSWGFLQVMTSLSASS